MTFWRKIRDMLIRSDDPSTKDGGGPGSRRLSDRKQQRLVQGVIWSERMAAPKACSIRNLSVSGARIDLLVSGVRRDLLEGDLILYLPAERREIDCQLVWHSGQTIGVRFLGSYREPTRQYKA
jgi:hypothetical protein